MSDVAFSGSVPENYDRYLVPWLFEAYAADLAGRVPTRDGVRVLELAAGTGAVTRRLREALPASATLVATDLNDAMIDYAREAVDEPGITWRTADAQALPFEDGSFDAVVCQFGFMFLPDKVRGFREARRVLAPGGARTSGTRSRRTHGRPRSTRRWRDSFRTTRRASSRRRTAIRIRPPS